MICALLPAAGLAFGESLFKLGVFGASGPQNMRHADVAAFVGGEKGTVESDVTDIAAGHVKLRQFVQFQSPRGRG